MSLNSGSQWEVLSVVNGELSSELSIKDRGLAYGDGLFETMRLEYGKIAFLPYHLARLARGLKALALNTNIDVIAQQITHFQALATQQSFHSAIVKLIVTRGEGGRGYAPDIHAKPNVILQLLPAPAMTDYPHSRLILAQSRIALADQQWLAGLKHLNRLEYILAAAEVEQRLSDSTALLCDQHGQVIESLHHNIFCVQGRHIYTPALHTCGVAGVLRQWLLDELAPSLQIPCLVLPLTLEQLAAADEVFVGNSVRGFIAVDSIVTPTHTYSWAVGPIGDQLQQAFRAKLAH